MRGGFSFERVTSLKYTLPILFKFSSISFVLFRRSCGCRRYFEPRADRLFQSCLCYGQHWAHVPVIEPVHVLGL